MDKGKEAQGKCGTKTKLQTRRGERGIDFVQFTQQLRSSRTLLSNNINKINIADLRKMTGNQSE